MSAAPGCRHGAVNADVVMTTEGGQQSAQAVLDAGALLGIASSHNPPSGLPIDFVDWPFSEDSPSWRQHIQMVRRHEPRYAVAPDVQEGRSLEWTIEKADVLAKHADCVIVPPKDVHPRQVPDRFRVGLPFQTGMGPGGIDLDDQQRMEDYTGGEANTIYDFGGPDVGDVHVLGGSPHDQLRIPSYGVDVRSVDTSLPVTYSRYGDVWFEAGRVEFGRDMDFYDRIEASLRNVLRAWGHDVALDDSIDEAIVEAVDELASMTGAEARRRERGRGPPLADPRGPDDVPGDHIPATIDNFVRHEYSDLLE